MIIDCFGTDRQAMDDIKSLFMQSLLKLAKDGKPLDFRAVYKDVMDSNVIPDIDIESAAFLYQEIRTEAYSLDKNIGSHMTSEAELDKIHSDANLKSIFKRGSKDSPASAIAKGVLSYLRNVGERGSGNEKDASKVRKIVADYAKSVLGVSRTGKTVDILAEAIKRDMEGTGFKDKLSYDAFFDKLKEELQETLSKVKDPVVRRSLDNELNKLKKASFKMGITETGRKKILYDILKEKYGKDTKNGRVVDWNAIAAQENPIAALRDALSDKLDKLGYKGDKNKIYEALQDEIEGIRNTGAYAKAITAMNLQGTTIVKRLAEEVAIARGFFDTVNGKKVVKYDVKNEAAIAEVIAEMKALGLVYDPNKMSNNFELLVSRYIKDKNISKIRGSILKLMAHNNKPFKAKVGEIDRLVKLNRKAGLDGTTSVLAGKILNISVNAVTMARMEALVSQYEKLMAYDQTDVNQMKELFPWYDLNEAYTPAIFASNAMQDIVKEMGILVRDAAVRDLANFPKLMVFLRRWQQAVLANRLTNLHNITQNILGGASGLRAAGEDFVKRAKKANNIEVDGIKEVLDAFKKYFTHDLTGESGTVRGYGIKNIYDAKTRGEKALAGINMLSTGILSAIDGYNYAQGVSRTFYAFLREDLRVKFEEDSKVDPKKIDAEIDKLLFPYFSAEYGEKAILLAKHYLEKVGVTEASMGTERYARTVAAEAENIRRSFFMSGPITNYISPERIQSAKKTAERMTEMELGRKDYHVMKRQHDNSLAKERKPNAWAFGINIAGSMIDYMDAQYNSALNAVIKNNNAHNTWKFVVLSGITLIAHGGPLAFLGGATRWADKALGSLVNAPFYALTNKVGRTRKAFKEVVKGVVKPGEVAYNEDDIIAHFEEYEIVRRRMKQGIEAWVVSATFLAAGIMIAGSWGGDDDDGYWEKLWKSIEGLMDSKFAETPMGETVMKRIMPLQVRLLYAVANSKKWDNSYNVQKNIETLSGVLYTHVPSTVGSLATRYYRIGDSKQEIAGKIFKEAQGAVFSLSPILNPLGWAGVSNPVIDQIRGSKKRVDYSNHPLLSGQGSTYDGKFIDGVADGMAWGLTDYALGYFLDKRGAMRTTGMEIHPEDYKKKFSDIDWSKYGESKYNAKKDAVEKTLPRLDRVAEEIENFARIFDIPEFKKTGAGKLAYTRYYNGIFSVSVKNVNLQKLKQYSGEKPSESGNINVLRVALNRVGLKDINIDEAEIAIKWRNLQEKL